MHSPYHKKYKSKISWNSIQYQEKNYENTVFSKATTLPLANCNKGLEPLRILKRMLRENNNYIYRKSQRIKISTSEMKSTHIITP